MTGKITIEQKWHQQSEDAKNEAEQLPQGKERDALVEKGPAIKDRLANQWMALIARATAAEVTRLS
jgi:hypothetical protein